MRYLLETTDWRRELVRYGGSAVVVLAVLVGSSAAFWHDGPETQEASEVDEAVLVDLPPAASAARATAAPDGPAQAATPARVAAPDTPTPPPLPDRPLDPAPPTADTPPAPSTPAPAAVLPAPHETTTPAPTPPPTPAAPASPPQDARAPDGADTPAVADSVTSEAARPHASARAITAWQRSLLKRLETAKRALAAAPRGTGTAEIAFEIDSAGALIAERIATSSGSPRLDATAAALVKLAAPFPAPPKGAGPDDRSFKIPIRFRR